MSVCELTADELRCEENLTVKEFIKNNENKVKEISET